MAGSALRFSRHVLVERCCTLSCTTKRPNEIHLVMDFRYIDLLFANEIQTVSTIEDRQPTSQRRILPLSKQPSSISSLRTALFVLVTSLKPQFTSYICQRRCFANGVSINNRCDVCMCNLILKARSAAVMAADVD